MAPSRTLEWSPAVAQGHNCAPVYSFSNCKSWPLVGWAALGQTQPPKIPDFPPSPAACSSIVLSDTQRPNAEQYILLWF